MGENTLSVKITADVVDLQTKFVTAKAEVNALTKQMNDLAKQSAAGILDPAGLAQLQDVSRQFLEAKQAAAEFKEAMGGVRESSEGIGGALEEIRGKIGTAFEITGIAAAYEAIKSVGEVIEQLGERATQMRAMSDVLGVTVEQFQAMSAAAEEGGTSVEVFARASERLIALLTQAREGSGAAREKLFDLGVALNQINDPAFKVNDLLQILHDRLLDSATAQETMNQLIKEFGPRAALAAEAFKSYDGSAAGVAATMSKLNGLTDEQTHKLHEMATAAKETGTWLTNAWSKMLALAGVDSSDQGVGKWAEKDDSKESAQAQKDLQREMQVQELQNIQAGVEAYKQGSAEKLAQLRIFYDATAAFYGADSDKALAAQRQVIAEQRSYYEAQASLRAEQVRATIKSDDDAVKARLAGIRSSIAANDQYFANAVKVHEAIKSMEETGLQLQTKVFQERAKLVAQETALNAKDAQLQVRQWQAATNAMQQGFATAFRGMIEGGQSFGTAMKDMFAQIADAAIQNAAKNLATMAMQSLVGGGIRSAEIRKDAGAGAAAAYKAVVGIPYVGPFLAPAAAAVAYAGILAFDSAEGGYDIPAGLNPVVQTHAREMILPAPVADTVRNAMENGNGGNSAGRGSTVHIHGKHFTHDQLAAMLKELGHRFKLA